MEPNRPAQFALHQTLMMSGNSTFLTLKRHKAQMHLNRERGFYFINLAVVKLLKFLRLVIPKSPTLLDTSGCECESVILSARKLWGGRRSGAAMRMAGNACGLCVRTLWRRHCDRFRSFPGMLAMRRASSAFPGGAACPPEIYFAMPK